MNNHEQTRLTSSELSAVWSSYMNNSFSACVMKYFLNNVDDKQTKQVVQLSLDISEQTMSIARKLLETDNQPIPIGFTDDDVTVNAPRLFSDAFYLYYLKNMAKVGLSVYGVALSTAAKDDVRQFLSNAIKESTDLYNETAEVLLEKGLYVRSPYVTTSDHTEFIHDKDYLGSMFNLQHKNRPLNVIEITHINANVEANQIGSALLTGFAQVAESEIVKKYCKRGKEIAKKHVKVFAELLTGNDLPAPMPWDIEVTDSEVSPFSDKLMVFHTSLINASSISNYATSSAASLRADVATTYVRLMTEAAVYAKDGFDLMIKKEFLEQPPQSPDRAKSKH
ncbi:DUF3231 family protein [Aquibacillus salsiterrae]|uniref:DUF3231 family protein n=1 Tax=Aquibacillus salsiterrae TaxID=2950439 RepID=A0A9X3WFV0_9BACI|nr:DUF3231 family protein [Aquibacillus salsiterrae]MDC3417666.1 DUF3231 family protein [Aquibacillus salsiterrae]